MTEKQTPDKGSKQTEDVGKFIDTLSKRSMPALATTVHRMGQLTRADDSRVSELTEQVLRDPTLTTRVLQVANSVIYRGAAGQVNTITRAIMLMGFTSIRDICVSMKILDEMLEKSPTQHLKNVMAKSFHAAMQAKGIASKAASGVKEEIFISSLLHHLGEMSVLSRDDELSHQLDHLITKKGLTPDQASKELLGFTFQELTLGLSNSWSLGDMLRQAVSPSSSVSRPVQAVLLGEELSQVAGLGWDSKPVIQVVERIADYGGVDTQVALEHAKQVADYAREVAVQYGADSVKHLIPPSNYTEKTAELLNVITYKEVPEEPDEPVKVMVELDITPDMIEAALQNVPLTVVDEMVQAPAPSIGLAKDGVANLDSSVLNELMADSTGSPSEVAPPDISPSDTAEVARPDIVVEPAKERINEGLHLEYMAKLGDLLKGKKVNVNEMFILIVEAMEEGLGLERIAMALLSPDRKQLKAKLFGGEISPEFESDFDFKVDVENAFSYVLGQSQAFWSGGEKAVGKEYLVTPTIDKVVGKGAFLVAPIVVARKPIGLFYADQRNSGAEISEQQYLNFTSLAHQVSTALTMLKG